jgi:hypothetical protein
VYSHVSLELEKQAAAKLTAALTGRQRFFIGCRQVVNNRVSRNENK